MVSVFVDRDGRWTDEYVKDVSRQGWLLFTGANKGNYVFPNIENYKSAAPIAKKISLSPLEQDEVLALARKVQADERGRRG